VLASGKGSNFEALVEALRESGGRHECVLLAVDRKGAFALTRAQRLGIPSCHISFADRGQAEAEAELDKVLEASAADLVALAGFMRILGPGFVSTRRGRLVNVHPSILPRWPGKDSVRRSHEAGEAEYGVTVHYVDEGVDTGPIIAQEAFTAAPGTGLAEIEGRIHDIEHRLFPQTILAILDQIESRRARA
jgi:phosphoribosylglycinamide formyltransferase-1